MKLSAKLIAYHLKKRWPLRLSGALSAEPKLKNVICYEGHKEFSDGHIYVANSADIVFSSHHLDEILLVLTENEFLISEKDYPNLCILPKEISSAEALNFINEIFAVYDQWNQNLIDSLLNNAPAQNYLDLTEGIIPNPMMLIGLDFTIIAAKKMRFNDLQSSILGASAGTFPLVNSLKNDANYEKAFYETGYFYYPGTKIAQPCLCCNIWGSTMAAYRIFFTNSKNGVPLDDTFGFVLEYLADMLSHALFSNAAQTENNIFQLRKIFTGVLTDPSSDYVETSQQLGTIGWLSSHYYLCVLIQTSLIDRKSRTILPICAFLENQIPSSVAVEYEGNAVFFINLDLCGLSEENIAGRLEAFLKSGMLNAGFSRRMLGHFNFYRQYTQSLVALKMGTRKNPMSFIHYFNPIALDYILEEITKNLPAYMICHEKLLSLKYADENNHSCLYETLRCYLEKHRNITLTSKALYIHRSTLLYRLEKIREHMGSDFSDPDELLYLLLSYHLMDLESR